ncbi:hypothetical protein ACKX2D_05645 [Lachnospiraceae bacterium YH-ros2226]
MKNQSVLLAKETEDGYISLGTITLMSDRSNDADQTEREERWKGRAMKEQFIWFTAKDVDGWDGNDITVVARVYGKELTDGTIDRIKDAIWDYMNNTNESDWDMDGYLDAAQGQLEKEGYKVDWIKADAEIFI